MTKYSISTAHQSDGRTTVRIEADDGLGPLAEIDALFADHGKRIGNDLALLARKRHPSAKVVFDDTALI
jgi:hypothetical protein